MVPEVLPIATTLIDWQTLLPVAHKCLGRSITAHLDAAGLVVSGLDSWIATLGGLRESGNKPADIIRDAGPLLKHGFVAFAILLNESTLMALLEDSALAVTSGETILRGVRLAVASGTLEQWRTTVINGCSEQSDYELRAILDKVMVFLEKMGLRQLWNGFQKRSLPDNTFVLEQHR